MSLTKRLMESEFDPTAQLDDEDEDYLFEDQSQELASVTIENQGAAETADAAA